jgi:hypothetical protein
MNKGELAMALIGNALQFCLLIQLLRLKSYREFPAFLAFLGFSIVSAITGVATGGHAHIYFYEYWISEVIYSALAFFALQEAVRSVFRNFHSLRWFKVSFPSIGILILIVALFRAAFFRSAHDYPLIVAIISLEIAIGFLQFGIFSLFIILVRLFHLRWGQHAAGIVFGFGVSAAGSLVAFLLRSEFGTKFDPVIRIAPPIAYIIGVAIWLATFLKAESGRPEAAWATTLTPEQMITEIKRHTKTVKGILGR